MLTLSLSTMREERVRRGRAPDICMLRVRSLFVSSAKKKKKKHARFSKKRQSLKKKNKKILNFLPGKKAGQSPKLLNNIRHKCS